MKIESIHKAYKNTIGNFNNKEVVFVEGKAEVSDELGQFMIQNFDHVFEEGHIKVKEVDTPIHVFDESMIDKQANDIVNLQNSLKARGKEIERLKDDVNSWKAKYLESQEQFSGLSQSKKVEEVVVKPEETEDDDLRKQLKSKSLSELKKIAAQMKVKDSTVKDKRLVDDWIDAILKQS